MRIQKKGNPMVRLLGYFLLPHLILFVIYEVWRSRQAQMPVYCDANLICAGGDPGYSDFFVLVLMMYVLMLAAGSLIALTFAFCKSK